MAKAAADKYNDAHRKAAAKLAQHYETLDLARWESYTLKQDLCNELDRLAEMPEAELPKAARRLQELREKWKQLGAVPKSKAEEINPRYLEATRKLQHRVDEYYANLRQQHKQAAAAKQELCEKAAALADSTEWNATAAAFKELQAAWKAIPGAGAQEKALFTAFRASADKFSTPAAPGSTNAMRSSRASPKSSAGFWPKRSGWRSSRSTPRPRFSVPNSSAASIWQPAARPAPSMNCPKNSMPRWTNSSPAGARPSPDAKSRRRSLWPKSMRLPPT